MVQLGISAVGGDYYRSLHLKVSDADSYLGRMFDRSNPQHCREIQSHMMESDPFSHVGEGLNKVEFNDNEITIVRHKIQLRRKRQEQRSRHLISSRFKRRFR